MTHAYTAGSRPVYLYIYLLFIYLYIYDNMTSLMSAERCECNPRPSCRDRFAFNRQHRVFFLRIIILFLVLLYRFKDGLQLRNGRRVDIVTDHDGNLELRIAGVTKRDSGAYTLRVSNGTGTVESRCDVTVVESRRRHDTGLEQISLTNQL